MKSGNGDSLSDGIRLAESAIALQKRTPLSILALYYIGALPFATGLLVAWNMLTLRPDAVDQQATAALVLAFLFAWMKVWQNRYAQALYSHAVQAPEPRCGLGGYFRLAGRQTLVHALGFVAVPLSLLALIPFPWVHGAFHSFTVLDDGGKRPLKVYWNEAIEHSKANPRQQLSLLWLFSPMLLFFIGFFILMMGPFIQAINPLLGESIFVIYYTVFAIVLLPVSPFPVGVFINVYVGAYFLFGIARSLFGIRTPFTEIPGLFVSPFYMVLALILCWLVLDPLMKSAYVIRHIESRSRKDGIDIQVALKKLSGAALLLLLLGGALLSSPAAYAQSDQAIDDASLEQAIGEELLLERYRWRAPLESQSDKEPTWLQEIVIGFLEGLRNSLDKAFEILEDVWDWLFPPRDPQPDTGGFGFIDLVRDSLRGILVALAVVLAILVLYLFYRYRKSQKELAVEAEGTMPLPDLESEETSADALPAEGWLGMAEQFLSRGDYRLAARAVYLGILASLAEQRRISLARYKTNRDYRRELERFAHVLPGIADTFKTLTRGYEAVWYGDRLADAELVAAMLSEHRRFQDLEA